MRAIELFAVLIVVLLIGTFFIWLIAINMERSRAQEFKRQRKSRVLDHEIREEEHRGS